MHPTTVLVAPLALFASGALAFYPYTPPWLKELEEHNAGEAKRSVDHGLTFAMKRRAHRRVSLAVYIYVPPVIGCADVCCDQGSRNTRRKGCMAGSLALSQIQRRKPPECQPRDTARKARQSVPHHDGRGPR